MKFIFTTSPWGLFIRVFEGGRASHVGIIDGDHIIDARLKTGVARRPYDEAMRGQTLVEIIDVALPNEYAAMQFALDQVGKPYDWTAIVGFMLFRDWSSEDRWYCSENCGATAMAGGITIADRGKRLGVRLFREIAHAHRRR